MTLPKTSHLRRELFLVTVAILVLLSSLWLTPESQTLLDLKENIQHSLTGLTVGSVLEPPALGLFAAGDEVTSENGWNKTFDSGARVADIAYGTAVERSNGSVYVVGSGSNLISATSGFDWWIKKFHANSTEDYQLWNKTFGFSGSDEALAVAIYNNTIYVVGYATNVVTTTSADDWWIKKFYSNSSEEINGWNLTFSSPTNTNDIARAVAVDSQGDVYVAGEITLTFGDSDWWIKKFYPNGTEWVSEWNKTFDGGTNDIPRALAIDGNNNVYVVGVGENIRNSTSDDDWWIKRFNSSGTENTTDWNKTFDSGYGLQDLARGAAVDRQNSVYVVGSAYRVQSSTSDDDWWLKKFFANGTEDITSWNKTFGGESNDSAYAVVMGQEGDVFIVGNGMHFFNTTSDKDWWIKKFNASTGVENTTVWNISRNGVGKEDIAFAAALNQQNTTLYAAGEITNGVAGASNADWWIKAWDTGVTQCGRITASIRLRQNWTAGGNCLVVLQDNLVIDGGGYALLNNGSGMAINITGNSDNVTVKNIFIMNFTTGINAEHGQNHTIYNVTILMANSSGTDIGILFTNISSSNISNNTITLRGSAGGSSSDYAIEFVQAGNNSIVANQIFTTSDAGLGISLETNSTRNNLSSNTINVYLNQYGISITGNSDQNSLTDNYINATGAAAGGGITISDSNQTVHLRNTIYTAGVGILLTGNPAPMYTLISANNITTTGGTGYGIQLGDGSGTSTARFTRIHNNTIIAQLTYEILDYTNITEMNYLVFNNTYGQIRWVNESAAGGDQAPPLSGNLTINLSNDQGLALGGNLLIDHNLASVNTSAFSIGANRINDSLNITLHQIGLTTVDSIYKDAGFFTASGTVPTTLDCLSILETETNAVKRRSYCRKESYNGSTLVFFSQTASSFTAASVVADSGTPNNPWSSFAAAQASFTGSLTPAQQFAMAQAPPTPPPHLTPAQYAAWATQSGLLSFGVSTASAAPTAGLTDTTATAEASTTNRGGIFAEEQQPLSSSVERRQVISVTIENKGDQEITLRGQVREDPKIVLPHEERVKEILAEKTASQALSEEERQQKIEEQLLLEKLKAEELVQPIYTTKTTPSFIGQAVRYTGEPTLARKLQTQLVQEEVFTIKPKEKVTRLIELKSGIATKARPIKIIFSSYGEKIFEQQVELQAVKTIGAAIDHLEEQNLFDFYLVFPPSDPSLRGDLPTASTPIPSTAPALTGAATGVTTGLPAASQEYFAEMSINRNGRSLYVEVFGPYRVNPDRGYVFAQQFKYNPAVFHGQYDVKITVLQSGRAVVENIFPLMLGKAGELPGKNVFLTTLQDLSENQALMMSILLTLLLGCLFIFLFMLVLHRRMPKLPTGPERPRVTTPKISEEERWSVSRKLIEPEPIEPESVLKQASSYDELELLSEKLRHIQDLPTVSGKIIRAVQQPRPEPFLKKLHEPLLKKLQQLFIGSAKVPSAPVEVPPNPQLEEELRNLEQKLAERYRGKPYKLLASLEGQEGHIHRKEIVPRAFLLRKMTMEEEAREQDWNKKLGKIEERLRNQATVPSPGKIIASLRERQSHIHNRGVHHPPFPPMKRIEKRRKTKAEEEQEQELAGKLAEIDEKLRKL